MLPLIHPTQLYRVSPRPASPFCICIRCSTTTLFLLQNGFNLHKFLSSRDEELTYSEEMMAERVFVWVYSGCVEGVSGWGFGAEEEEYLEIVQMLGIIQGRRGSYDKQREGEDEGYEEEEYKEEEYEADNEDEEVGEEVEVEEMEDSGDDFGIVYIARTVQQYGGDEESESNDTDESVFQPDVLALYRGSTREDMRRGAREMSIDSGYLGDVECLLMA